MSAKKSDDDLFAETTMTFGEHLEELRVCLWRAIVGLVIGTILGFFLADYVVKLIEHPLTNALKIYYRTAAEKEYQTWSEEQLRAGRPVPYTLEEVSNIANATSGTTEKELIFELEFVHPSTLQDSLDSLRIPAAQKPGGGEDATKTTEANPKDLNPGDAEKLDRSGQEPKTEAEKNAAAEKKALPSRYNRANLAPLLLWHPIDSDQRFKMQGTGVSEVFTVWLKAAIVVGVLVSSPWVFYQIWMFVASGLYPTERKYVYMYLPFSLGLFLIGAATAYLFVFAPVLDFLLGFNQSLGIDPDPKISEWLSFVLLLPLGFGVSFQLPLVMLFLERIGVLSVNAYLEKWRIAVLVIFVISAILTPADPYSIFFMAVPLTVLYFLGILLAKYLPKN